MTTLIPFIATQQRVSVQKTQSFRLSVDWKKDKTIITMSLFADHVTTKHMPHVLSVLRKHLPTILRSTCFNEEDIPFSEEVRATELGHLFEHILLEYLCKEKIRLGCQEAIFSGITKWDWNRYPYGTFHIHITIPYEDRIFFAQAFQKATQLFTIILEKQRPVKQQYFLSPQPNNFSV